MDVTVSKSILFLVQQNPVSLRADTEQQCALLQAKKQGVLVPLNLCNFLLCIDPIYVQDIILGRKDIRTNPLSDVHAVLHVWFVPELYILYSTCR